jgi:hypothetical protein
MDTYYDWINGSFLNLGNKYTFMVYGNAKVPDLTQGIFFPTREAYITSR